MKVPVVALVACAATVAASPAFADAQSDAKSQVEFGINVAQRGLWREAIYRWEKATEIDPTYAAAFNDLAIAYEHEGQLDKARKAYEKALELDPNNTQIRQNYELFKEINDRTSARARTSSARARGARGLLRGARAGLRPRLLRDPDRNADPAQAGRLARSSACSSPASSPAAPRTSTPTRKRCACCAASCARSRRCKVIDADVMPLHRRRAGAEPGRRRRATRPTDATSERDAGAAPPAPAAQALALPQGHQGREGSRAVRAAVREHRVLEADRRGISRTR